MPLLVENTNNFTQNTPINKPIPKHEYNLQNRHNPNT